MKSCVVLFTENGNSVFGEPRYLNSAQQIIDYFGVASTDEEVRIALEAIHYGSPVCTVRISESGDCFFTGLRKVEMACSLHGILALYAPSISEPAYIEALLELSQKERFLIHITEKGLYDLWSR